VYGFIDKCQAFNSIGKMTSNAQTGGDAAQMVVYHQVSPPIMAMVVTDWTVVFLFVGANLIVY
jgi:hypothetical protein